MKIVEITSENFDLIPKPIDGSSCQDCAYWQGSSGGDAAEQKRQSFIRGVLKGKIALDDKGTAMGYIQYGQAESFPLFNKLRRSFTASEAPNAWVITCIMTHGDFRGRGVSQALLKAVIAEAASQNLTLEAVGFENADFNLISGGPASLYRKAGFIEVERFTDKYGINILLRLAM